MLAVSFIGVGSGSGFSGEGWCLPDGMLKRGASSSLSLPLLLPAPLPFLPPLPLVPPFPFLGMGTASHALTVASYDWKFLPIGHISLV